ncbi:glycine-rich cell wall structural protein-like [Belonocnema kinseyi]|uniref:glycine-rich cell wall structural protein-like n=1 Tax=Belonocnema kinseyi TaxID=2817044 RepID=UPI00143DFC83|nr:glycine-rich cell wall structural protein-like [Belonocnema kinseyi]
MHFNAFHLLLLVGTGGTFGGLLGDEGKGSNRKEGGCSSCEFDVRGDGIGNKGLVPDTSDQAGSLVQGLGSAPQGTFGGAIGGLLNGEEKGRQGSNKNEGRFTSGGSDVREDGTGNEGLVPDTSNQAGSLVQGLGSAPQGTFGGAIGGLLSGEEKGRQGNNKNEGGFPSGGSDVREDGTGKGDLLPDKLDQAGGLVKGLGSGLKGIDGKAVGDLLRGEGKGHQARNEKESGFFSNEINVHGEGTRKGGLIPDTLDEAGGLVKGLGSGLQRIVGSSLGDILGSRGKGRQESNTKGSGSINGEIQFDGHGAGTGSLLPDTLNQAGGLVQGLGNEVKGALRGVLGGLLEGEGKGPQESHVKKGSSISNEIDDHREETVKGGLVPNLLGNVGVLMKGLGTGLGGTVSSVVGGLLGGGANGGKGGKGSNGKGGESISGRIDIGGQGAGKGLVPDALDQANGLVQGFGSGHSGTVRGVFGDLLGGKGKSGKAVEGDKEIRGSYGKGGGFISSRIDGVGSTGGGAGVGLQLGANNVI